MAKICFGLMVHVAKFATTKWGIKLVTTMKKENHGAAIRFTASNLKQISVNTGFILFIFCNNIKILTIIFSVQMYIFFKWGARPPLITTRSLMVAVWLVRGQPMRPLHTPHHVPTCPPLPATPQPCHPTSPPPLPTSAPPSPWPCRLACLRPWPAVSLPRQEQHPRCVALAPHLMCCPSNLAQFHILLLLQIAPLQDDEFCPTHED